MVTFRDEDKLTDADAAQITKWVGMYGFEFRVLPGNEIFAEAVGEYMPDSTQAIADMVRARLAGSPFIADGIGHYNNAEPSVYTITVRRPHVECPAGSGYFK